MVEEEQEAIGLQGTPPAIIVDPHVGGHFARVIEEVHQQVRAAQPIVIAKVEHQGMGNPLPLGGGRAQSAGEDFLDHRVVIVGGRDLVFWKATCGG